MKGCVDMVKQIKSRRQTKGAAKRRVPARRGKIQSRESATAALTQGTGALPRKPFGSTTQRVPSTAVWDAKLPHHLSLPRPVGPYTVVRTTKRFSTSSKAVLLGTFKFPTGAETGNRIAGEWSNICAVYPNTAADAAKPINDPTAYTPGVPSPLTFNGAGTSAATCVPSAFTVQIMNPNALQTTHGMLYAGVMHTQADLGGRTESWNDYFDRFVNFQSPRMLAAAKLALRGVQINSYPLNMTPVSEFTTLASREIATHIPMNGNNEVPCGWAPILVSNPQEVEIEFLVTTEWRVRFDLMNPASAGHVHHPIHHDGMWDSLMKNASNAGNNVKDIADVVLSLIHI